MFIAMSNVANVIIALVVAALVYFIIQHVLEDTPVKATDPIIPVAEPKLPNSIPFTGDGGPGLGLSFETLLY